MYAVALRMCGHREDAQDCLQEAMLRVYRSISSFKGQSSFSTWVYRITMNTCLDELRRGKRRKASSLDERIDAGWAPVDDMDTPEHHAMRSEQRRALERAIQELPEDMRSAVVLRDIQGCSYDEIADVLVDGYAMGSLSMTAYTLQADCPDAAGTDGGAAPLQTTLPPEDANV